MYQFRPLRSMFRWPITPSRLITRSLGIKETIFKRFQTIQTNGRVLTPPPSPSPKKPTGLKALMKEYGYSAFGVYMALSAIDLPLCYILVHSMGQEEIEYYENQVKQQFGYGLSLEDLKKKQKIRKAKADSEETSDHKPDGIFQYILSQFSWTEFALAYGIHKSLIFIRVPVCAAITPAIVKSLRKWGFKLGTDKLSTTANIAKDTIKDMTASSPKFGTKPNSKKKWFSWFF